MKFCTMNPQIHLEEGDWLIIPKHLLEAVLDKVHNPVYAEHFSVKKLIRKLSLTYHWPGMRGMHTSSVLHV